MLRRWPTPSARVVSKVGAASCTMSAIALYVDAPVADREDGAYDGGRRGEIFPEWLHNVARVPLFGAATLISKVWLQLLNRTKVEGVAHLVEQLETRPKGTAVITVSNHSATVDDPAVLAKYGAASLSLCVCVCVGVWDCCMRRNRGREKWTIDRWTD